MVSVGNFAEKLPQIVQREIALQQPGQQPPPLAATWEHTRNDLFHNLHAYQPMQVLWGGSQQPIQKMSGGGRLRGLHKLWSQSKCLESGQNRCFYP